MSTVPLPHVGEQGVLGGMALPVTAETIEVLVELVTEAERRLAAVAAALRDDEARHGEAAVTHSERFRRVSNRYPRRVAEAYGDLAYAVFDSDEQVAATVAGWERAHGLEPVDWQAVGAEEREDEGRAA